MMYGFFFVFFATIIPHGLLELPAICLAAALPFGTYRFVREATQKGAVTDVFRDFRVAIRSQHARQRLGYITCLFLPAGFVESHLTPFVTEWVSELIR